MKIPWHKSMAFDPKQLNLLQIDGFCNEEYNFYRFILKLQSKFKELQHNVYIQNALPKYIFKQLSEFAAKIWINIPICNIIHQTRSVWNKACKRQLPPGTRFFYFYKFTQHFRSKSIIITATKEFVLDFPILISGFLKWSWSFFVNMNKQADDELSQALAR